MPLALPLPDLASLDLLRSVAERGSIRQAAEAHRISQPAASMRLRSLERAVGLTLLDRSSGGARLTPEGRAVVEWSERVIDGMEALLAGVAAIRTEGRTQLRLAASMTVAEYLLPGWLQRLRAARPGIALSLQMGNSDRVAELTARRQVDLGFVEGRHVPAGFRSRRVVEDRLILVVAPGHPWARRRRPVQPDELAATPLVLREVGSGTREVLEGAMGELGLAVTTLVELGSTTAIKAAVASGTGPAVLSRLAVEEDVRQRRLAVVALEGLSLDRAVRAIWLPERRLVPTASSLLAVASAAPAAVPRSPRRPAAPGDQERRSGEEIAGGAPAP
ncbi:MAG: LysR family transcriptional regulator [Acidimicrobiales bacterium]